MRIFNEDKTKELFYIDEWNGYLRPDVLVIAHHDAVPEKVIKTVEEQVAEYEAQGKEVTLGDNGKNYYLTVEFIPKTGNMEADGRTVELIEPIIHPAQKAWDEYEDIQVYVPFTPEQKKDYLRDKRDPLLSAFDKWEKAVLRGREVEDERVMQWYYDLLDLKEDAFKENNIPARVQYYL